MLYDISGNPVAGAIGNAKKGWKKNGVLDALAITKQLCLAEWQTETGGMPKTSSSVYSNGEETTGVPYSSASMEDGYIGLSISLYTFMSAVHNPRSVLYTTESKGYTGVAYYGTVCTSLVCAAWGLPCLITTAAFPKVNWITPVDFADMELGDMILSSGHAKLITGLTRDTNGNISTVQTSESKTPHCIQNTYLYYSDFVSEHTGYNAYRYNYIDSVDDYDPSPFLRLMDEDASTAEFPDIMTCFGDKVTRKLGTDVVINVLDSTGYSSIEVYKDGVKIDTKSTLADFTITAPGVGAYEVRMIGNGKTSSTFFDIVDCKITLNGNTAEFTTTFFATAIGGFPTYTVNASGKATSWNNPKRNRFLTEAENTAREIDITEFRNDTDCNGGIRLYVKGAYGTVSFEQKYN